MKILVVGGGGREHAIVMKLAESSQVEALYCAPGNGGIAKYAKCFPVKATDIDGMVKLAKELAVIWCLLHRTIRWYWAWQMRCRQRAS